MSDILRTRIAALLNEAYPSGRYARYHDVIAGELIRKLGLFAREPLPDHLHSYLTPTWGTVDSRPHVRDDILDGPFRTRITDAIWDGARTIGSTLSLKASGLIADAVIRELNVFKEDGECSYCCAQLPGCRYICDWKTDD